MSNNRNLNTSKAAKNDEFYTFRSDIEEELSHYPNNFVGKVVYCNCDKYRQSEFINYFIDNFKVLGLKKLIATSYNKIGNGEVIIYDGITISVNTLDGDGDFRSDECIGLLEECDIVVTNPPFSLFRDYFSTLVKHQKDFLIIGNLNAVTYKNVFPYIQYNQVRLGYVNKEMNFFAKDGTIKKFGNIVWFTTFEVKKPPIELIKNYDKRDYPKYDNYDAINVDKLTDIPNDYNGNMGVPITFLTKWNQSQFKLVNFGYGNDGKDLHYTKLGGDEKALFPHYYKIVDKVNTPILNGNKIFKRLIIKISK